MEYIRADKVAQILGISLRAVQKKCKGRKLEKDSEGYLISADVVKSWLLDKKRRPDLTNEPANRRTKKKSSLIVQEFTEEEFEYLDKLIKTDYPVLMERTKQQQQQIRSLEENLKLSNNRINLLTEMLGDQNKTLQQKNTLELIDKTKPKKNN